MFQTPSKPLLYNGVTYRDCTTIDNGSTKWCATSVSETGVLKDYGDCAGDCSVVNKPDSIGGCPTTNGRRCVFPFKYNEVTYNECTKEGFGDTFWCATTVSSNGDTIAYGICTANCPKPSTLSSEVCGTINGKACVFPFVYGEVSYKACTSVDNNDVPWCATSTNPSNHQYISYGNCKQSCKASTIDVISISQSSVSNSPIKPAIDITIKPSKIDTTIVQPSRVDTTTVKPSKIDTTTVKPSRIDTTTMEPQTSAPAQKNIIFSFHLPNIGGQSLYRSAQFNHFLKGGKPFSKTDRRKLELKSYPIVLRLDFPLKLEITKESYQDKLLKAMSIPDGWENCHTGLSLNNMDYMLRIFLFGFCCFLIEAHADNEGKTWVLLVAGSNTWDNYRHQADVCHAYQIARTHGIPDERIVVMMYDDIASNKVNPTPGKMINKPGGLGPKNSSTQLPRIIFFVYFADHGGPGLLAFPDDVLQVGDLNKTIHKIQKKKQFKKLVFYVEACESGSMFDGVLTGLKKIELYDTYLGDVYSVNWLEDSDKEDLKKETIEKQFDIVRKETNTSHVTQFGDKKVAESHLSEFLGQKNPEYLRSIQRKVVPWIPFHPVMCTRDQ
ncbi:LGMN [Lepeophtheirus salmonis]|uniref:LGMN n=1 Tax=Lepeophtheirus salmonis TaxID=72036 RepID=A0A7R8CJM0_LEPSM|nr:LGMN [Lepeophtheirus salmonis]CAF2843032.1 LGMN [Lepeophtheirus salmonis]